MECVCGAYITTTQRSCPICGITVNVEAPVQVVGRTVVRKPRPIRDTPGSNHGLEGDMIWVGGAEHLSDRQTEDDAARLTGESGQRETPGRVVTTHHQRRRSRKAVSVSGRKTQPMSLAVILNRIRTPGSRAVILAEFNVVESISSGVLRVHMVSKRFRLVEPLSKSPRAVDALESIRLALVHMGFRENAPSPDEEWYQYRFNG